MKIKVSDNQGVCLITISGRVDSNSSGDLESALYEAIYKNSRIIMDLEDTEYISSSGLRVLLAGMKMLKAKNGEIILTSLQPMVRDIFEIAGLTRIFLTKKSWEDALSAQKCQQ